MAKKRLNKKVAIIGSAVFTLLVLAAIGVILYLSQEPGKFIKDGDTARLAKNYQEAERNYKRAFSRARTDSLKIEIYFKLVDMYIEADKWRDVIGCWNGIIRLDPKNVKARYGRLKYFYLVADSGVSGFWQDVASQASEFINAVGPELLAENTAKLEYFADSGAGGTAPGGQRLGPYLYLVRGRAALEMTRRGGVTDKEESLTRAVSDLEKVRELEPNNINAYRYLAQTIITRGEVLAAKGSVEERDKAAEQARKILEQAVKVAGGNAESLINLLKMKLEIMIDQKSTLKQFQALEPEYLSLVQKFPSSAKAFEALSEFYMSVYSTKKLAQTIEASEKAVELDKGNVTYAINAANLYYRKFSIYGQKDDLYKAIDIAKNALTLPGAQEKEGGPRQWANRVNRLSLDAFLANCYIEQVITPFETRTEEQKQQWLTNGEQMVHEIEQLLGSAEEPQAIKWQGMLELAKGNRKTAIKQLYTAYEQLKAAGKTDPQLSYTLAKVFRNSTEVGAVMEFLASAINSAIAQNKPESLLDYADMALKLNAWPTAIAAIDTFEGGLQPNTRSRTLRIKAYIGAKQFDDAEKELSRMPSSDSNTVKLNIVLVQAKIDEIRNTMARQQVQEGIEPVLQGVQKTGKEAGQAQGKAGSASEGAKGPANVEAMTSELKKYEGTLAELVGKLLSMDPNAVETTSVIAVYRDYVAENKLSQAGEIVDRILKSFPDNREILFYKRLLSEPEPGKVSTERIKKIEQENLLSIADPVRQAMSLGIFYQRNNEPNNAAEEFKKVLKMEAGGEQAGKITDSRQLAAAYLFDLALGMKDWKLAEEITDIARREDMDECEGRFFAARLAASREQYEDALAGFDECLKQRPVFSYGYMLRSRVNSALGKEHEAIEDIQKAASLNPMDGVIAKELASVLYSRNQKLGSNVSSDQVIETRTTLERAMALNRHDLQLLSFYAEYISSTEPTRALAIRQELQKVAPSIPNAILLGKLATKVALAETDQKRKEALFAVAESSFEQARKIDPRNKTVLYSYAEYYRDRGQDEKAEQLLKGADDQKLLWNHYYQSGQFEDANKVLQQLYSTTPKDVNVVKGLVLVAEKNGDKEAVKRYSEELLSLDSSVENNLIEIQTFLMTGLIKEAEYKLQSFREKYPDEPRALQLNTWLAMKQGKLKAAMEMADRNLESNQSNAVMWRLRGEINYLMANYEKAIADFKKSQSLLDEPSTRIVLAKSCLATGRVEDAITELKNVVDKPEAPLEARALLEQVYMRFGKKEALRQFYDETLKKFPNDYRWLNRAGAFSAATGDFKGAEQLYLKAWQKDEKSGRFDAAATSLDGYLHAMVMSGKLDKVLQEAGKYVDGNFASVAFLKMAEAKLKLGDKALAIQYCRKAVDKAGTDEAIVFGTMRSIYSLLGADETLKLCRKKLDDSPDSLTANFTMYNLMKVSGEYNKAADYIDKCIQITGPDTARGIDARIKKAIILQMAYIKTQDKNYLERAVTEYESLLAKMPNNTGVLNNLAYLLAENDKKLAEALQYAKTAVGINPNSPEFLDTYSYVLYKNEKYTEADESLQSAMQLYEQSGASVPVEVYEHLGMIKEKLGEKDKAVAAYNQALEAGKDTILEADRERIKGAVERLSGKSAEHRKN